MTNEYLNLNQVCGKRVKRQHFLNRKYQTTTIILYLHHRTKEEKPSRSVFILRDFF